MAALSYINRYFATKTMVPSAFSVSRKMTVDSRGASKTSVKSFWRGLPPNSRRNAKALMILGVAIDGIVLYQYPGILGLGPEPKKLA